MKHQYSTPRSFNRLLLFSVLFLLTCFVSTASPASITGSVSFQYSLGGSARYGLIDNDAPLLYSLMGSRLFIADISNISRPVEIGTLALPGIGRRIAQRGDILFIACTHGGLAAIDVADPTRPVLLSVTTFDKSDAIGQTFGVAVKDQYVYVADYSGAFVVDMTNPAAPVKVGEFTSFEKENHNAYDAYVSNNTLFISCEFDGVYIFDISAPAILNKISHYPGQYYSSVRDGNYLYIAAGGAGLDILDISNLANPQLIANLENNYGGILQLVKVGNYVYLCSEFEDFYKIDVSDPGNPRQVQQFLLGGNHSLGISTTGNYVVLANSNYGIRIFDHRATAIQQVGEFLSLGRVVDCKGAGDYAYAAVGLKGLAILDMTNPFQPLQVAQKTLSGYANGLAVSGTTLFVAETKHEGEESGMLEIVDVADPLAPVILGSVVLTGQPYSVAVRGNVAVVACQTTGLSIVDISDTSNPKLIGTYDTSGVCYVPTLWGDYIVAADGLKGFISLDIKNPAVPKKIVDSFALGYNHGNVVDIALWDTWMYLPAGDGLHIANLDPLYLPMSNNDFYIAPITNRHLTGLVKAVAAFDGYLLVADSVGGVRLFDIAQPDSPQEIDSVFYSVTDPLRINYAEDQGIAYVPSGIGGLYIVKVTVPEKSVAQANGIWFGTGTHTGNDSSIGIVVDFYQGHDNVMGTLTMYGDTILEGSVSATTTDEPGNVKGTILYADGSTGALNLKKSGSGLTGRISAGSFEVADIALTYMTERGLLSLKKIAPTMDIGITSALTSSRGTQKRRLRRAQNMMTVALDQPTLAGQLQYSALALAMIPPRTAVGALAASESMLYQSALWEIRVAQAEARTMAGTICEDYRQRISRFLSIGNSAFENGLQAGENGRLASALYLFSTAARYYQQLAAYYQENVVNCPNYGVGVFNGYYEGVIDFGFIMASLKVCAAQNGEIVTGDVRIDIEASNEHMNGWIAEVDDVASDPLVEDVGKNVTVIVNGNEESVVTGMILVRIGEITAHLKILDWKYNISTDQWEGKLEVQEQKVTGNVTLKKSSDFCPEGFPEI